MANGHGESQARRQRRRPPASLLIAGVLIALLAWVPLRSVLRMAPMMVGSQPSRPWAAQQAQPPLVQPLGDAVNQQQLGLIISTGIHLENVYGLSLKDKAFNADGRIWLSWPQELQTLLEQKGFNPLQLVDFVNQVEDWNGDLAADNPAPEWRDGAWQQSYRFSRRFYIHHINLHRFPFNQLDLVITLQTTPALTEIEGRTIALLPVKHQRGIIGEYAHLDGYALRSAEIRPLIRTFRTDYGLNRQVRTNQIETVLHYQHSFWPAFISDVLPLAIILMVVLISPYLEGSLGDIRIAIPSTALLSLVFLQQTYRSMLPPSPDLTYLDRLYAVSYLICLLLFILFAWSSNVYERTPIEQRESLVRRLDVYDRNFQLLAIAMLTVVSLEAWLL